MADKSTMRGPYHVVIVGGGLLGLSAAYHLTKEKKFSVALVDKKNHESLRREIYRTSGGYLDNFTRLSHQWGEEKAKELWDFSEKAYLYTHELADSLGVSSRRGKSFRYALSLEEEREMKQAILGLKKAEFFCHEKLSPLKEVFLIQNEGERGGWLDVHSLERALKKSLQEKVHMIEGSVTGVVREKEGVRVLLENEELNSETVVLSCHTQISKFLPELKDVLVTYEDQSHILSFEVEKFDSDWKNLSFSAFHSYLWGVFLSETKLQVGGGRHLRKFAGIGSEKAILDTRVKEYLLSSIGRLFPALTSLEVESSYAGIEVRPCDETLVLGPMYGESRVFLGAGFMGQGLTLGVYGGLCLSELILKGVTENLPPFFYPDRFRSL